MDASVAVALIAGISGVIGAIVTGYISLKTNQRIDELEDEVKVLQGESCHQKKIIIRLKKYSRECWDGIQSLLRQICDLGHEPVWRPESPPELEDEE